jgi:hypothetical protein
MAAQGGARRSNRDGMPMTLDDVVKILEALKWPAVAVIALYLFRAETRNLVSGLRSRNIKFAGAEATAERIEQITPPAASLPVHVVTAATPHPFELSDNPFFQSEVQALTQRVQAIPFSSTDEKLRWMLREGAGLLVRLEYEKIYRDVWASQMELLGAANRLGGITEQQAREHYSTVAQAAPAVYANYTFDQWIRFLVAFGLLDVANQNWTTTGKGQLFIQYLVDQRYELHGRYPGR